MSDFNGKFAFIFGAILISIATFMVVNVSYQSGGQHIQDLGDATHKGVHTPMLLLPFVIGFWIFGLKAIFDFKFNFLSGKIPYIFGILLVGLYCVWIVSLDYDEGFYWKITSSPANPDAYEKKPDRIQYASIFFVPLVLLYWIFGWKYYIKGWKNDQKNTLAHQTAS